MDLLVSRGLVVDRSVGLLWHHSQNGLACCGARLWAKMEVKNKFACKCLIYKDKKISVGFSVWLNA